MGIPHLDKIQKNSYFFGKNFPYDVSTSAQISSPTNRSTSWLHLARFAIRRAFLMLSSQPSSRKTESWKSSHFYLSSFHRHQPPYQLKFTVLWIISVLFNIIINFDSISNYYRLTMKHWKTTWKYPSELLLPSEKVNRPWPQILPARNSEVEHNIKSVIMTLVMCRARHGSPPSYFIPSIVVKIPWPWNQPWREQKIEPSHKEVYTVQCTSLFLVKKNLHEFALVTWAVRKSHHLKMKTNVNKTISDGGITVNFWIIKVHTSNWSSNSWRSSNSLGS